MMHPSSVLVLYICGYTSLALGLGFAFRSLNTGPVFSFLVAIVMGFAYQFWFLPRYDAYRRAWRS